MEKTEIDDETSESEGYTIDELLEMMKDSSEKEKEAIEEEEIEKEEQEWIEGKRNYKFC